jgi:hypothetical protein
VSKKTKASNLIPKGSADLPSKGPKFLNTNVTELRSYKEYGNNATVMVSLRYLRYEQECLSDWTKEKVKKFWEFLSKIHFVTWQQLYSQATKKAGEKVGYGYTPLPTTIYPETEFKNSLSPDITLFELRIDNKSRVHGFRDEAFFYILWLDENHKITGN